MEERSQVAPRCFDVLVVGAGPAGSIAALVLARAGANVALLDKARFPRDKACGDFVGPRGLQVLADLGVPEPPGVDVGDMVVVGPTGRRVVLPAFDGSSYPGRARAVTRWVFDDTLRTAALDSGAVAVEGRADRPLVEDTETGSPLSGFVLDSGGELHADFVIGADGATSHVARTAGLVEEARVLWGFAVRSYVDQPVDLPVITLWEQSRWRAFPGYGWIFPSPGGGANLGIGVATLGDRRTGGRAVHAMPAYLDHLAALGLLDRSPERTPGRLGGWLKMGMLGTVPASGRVLLAGDAAGLVNPLQGEGIAQAMTSGSAAAQAILGSPGSAAPTYLRYLADTHLPYQRITATAHSLLVPRPRAIAALGRAITAPGVGQAVAGGWGIFWNELLDGATPGAACRVATASTWIGRTVTAGGPVPRWFRTTFDTSPGASVR